MPHMGGFHKRYMKGSRVCRCWANMVRNPDISMNEPQHRHALPGKAVGELIWWNEGPGCGNDLLMQNDYRIA